MELNHEKADFFIPDQKSGAEAVSRTTHLAIGAHQDDLEIMAYQGIEECYASDTSWFGGIVITNGAGSSRTGLYADYTDETMQAVRCEEQRQAAVLGKYSFVAQLAYPSLSVKAADREVVDDLESLLRAASPEVVYVHNPADKHPTHIACLVRTLTAIRRLDPSERPRQLFGVEVWRDLDWMDDASKVLLRTDQRPNLASALIALFDSQITGGKRYDLAVPGRRLANATFYDSHTPDALESTSFAMDLSPLLEDEQMKLSELVDEHLKRFRQGVLDNLISQEDTYE